MKVAGLLTAIGTQIMVQTRFGIMSSAASPHHRLRSSARSTIIIHHASIYLMFKFVMKHLKFDGSDVFYMLSFVAILIGCLVVKEYVAFWTLLLFFIVSILVRIIFKIVYHYRHYKKN